MKNKTIKRNTVTGKRSKTLLPYCKYNSGHRMRLERHMHPLRADFLPGEHRAL